MIKFLLEEVGEEKRKLQKQEDRLKEQLELGLQQGMQQGMQQREFGIARNLKSMQMSINDIMQATGLSQSTIEKL